MPPVWNQRAPSLPKMWFQSMSPGLRAEAAVFPRSGFPTAPRMPNPRSVKLRPLRTVRADAVVLAPLDEVGGDAALHDEVLDEVSDFVVDERGDDGGFVAEAFAEAAGGVVFAAAFPSLELAGGADAAFARVEAEHDFAE